MAFALSLEWDEHQNLQIRDVHEKQRERVLEYVRHHFLSNELFKVLGYHEEPAVQQDLQRFLKHLLENDCTIVAVDAQTEDIQAVALLKWMSEEWHSWTELSLLITSQRFGELIELIRSTVEAYAKDRGELWNSLHLFGYHVEAAWREDECFMNRFFKAICEVARHVHMPRVTYMALSQSDRGIVVKAGFQEIVRIIYSMYVSKGRRPFDHLRDINEMYAGLYEKKVERIVPYEKLVIRHSREEEEEETKIARKKTK